MAWRAAVVLNPSPRDRDVQPLAVPTAERQLSVELRLPLELLVPGLELMPKLGRPERKRVSYTHELRTLEPEQLAQAPVDRADPAVLDEQQPVGNRGKELSGRRELGVRAASDGASRRAAEPVGEHRCTGHAERRCGSERCAHAAPALTFRSNLCHARSPRRKRHVPLSRAHAMIGR